MLLHFDSSCIPIKFCYAPKNSTFYVFKSLYELQCNVSGCQVIDTFQDNETLSSLLIVDYSYVLSRYRKNIQKLHKSLNRRNN